MKRFQDIQNYLNKCNFLFNLWICVFLFSASRSVLFALLWLYWFNTMSYRWLASNHSVSAVTHAGHPNESMFVYVCSSWPGVSSLQECKSVWGHCPNCFKNMYARARLPVTEKTMIVVLWVLWKLIRFAKRCPEALLYTHTQVAVHTPQLGQAIT